MLIDRVRLAAVTRSRKNKTRSFTQDGGAFRLWLAGRRLRQIGLHRLQQSLVNRVSCGAAAIFEQPLMHA